MKRFASILITLSLITLLGGCDVNRPSYGQVRDETVMALEKIAEMVPEPKSVDTGEEQEPYSCSDPLLLSEGTGSFYTGHWIVKVPETFDVEAFVESLPSMLGDGWETQELGVQASFAAVDLVETSTGVSVAVEDHSTDGRRDIDLLAMSRCGILPKDEPEPLGPGGVREG